MKLAGARVAVVGMARSGVAVVELLMEKGARVTAVDMKPVHDERLERLGVSVLPQDDAALEGADLIVLSPGVLADAAQIEKARQRGVRVIGDLELASWSLEGRDDRDYGLKRQDDDDGFDGTHSQIERDCCAGWREHRHAAGGDGGNVADRAVERAGAFKLSIGDDRQLSSACGHSAERDAGSSGPALHDAAVCVVAKARLFENQRSGDFAVLNADDPMTREYGEIVMDEPHWFSSTHQVPRGAWLRDEQTLVLESRPLMEAREVPLRGVHNLENTMAAAIAARLAGAAHEQIREAVMSFPGVEHRLEFVRELDGVGWYNDSKATNVDATLKAIAAFSGELWVILGGKDKDADYAPLAAPLKEKAHAALLIGAAAGKIEGQLRGALPLIACGTLEGAVAEARMRAHSGDAVLLAPACASFDQFENFEHRGREFKRLVNALGAER